MMLMMMMIHQQVSVVSQCSLMPECRVGLRRSTPNYGKRYKYKYKDNKGLQSETGHPLD